jgi:hypothetical protein
MEPPPPQKKVGAPTNGADCLSISYSQSFRLWPLHNGKPPSLIGHLEVIYAPSSTTTSFFSSQPGESGANSYSPASALLPPHLFRPIGLHWLDGLQQHRLKQGSLLLHSPSFVAAWNTTFLLCCTTPEVRLELSFVQLQAIGVFKIIILPCCLSLQTLYCILPSPKI